MQVKRAPVKQTTCVAPNVFLRCCHKLCMVPNIWIRLQRNFNVLPVKLPKGSPTGQDSSSIMSHSTCLSALHSPICPADVHRQICTGEVHRRLCTAHPALLDCTARTDAPQLVMLPFYSVTVTTYQYWSQDPSLFVNIAR